MIRDQIDYHKVKTAFQKELQLASAGKLSSVSYIKHTLPDDSTVTHGIFQGIVIGGTNYVDSTRRIFKSGNRKTLSLKYGTLPIFKDRETLVGFLTKHLNPNADIVGLNFGFPLKPVRGPFGEIDSKLLHGTKEHTFANVTTSIGEIVREIYKTHYRKIIPVSVANDSVCLALSDDGLINGSLIVGTGVNMCLKVTKGKKISIINLEAGNFNKFPISSTLKSLDRQSAMPGTQLLEKIVSGHYMPLYFNTIAKELGLAIGPFTSSKDLTELAKKRSKKPEILLAREILEQSASLVAAITAGMYAFEGSPKNFTLIAEGSVFWKGWKYKEMVKKRLFLLGIPDGIITFKHVRDSSIKGAIGLLVR